MTEQRDSTPKMAYLLNSLISSTSRQEEASLKTQIKNLLQSNLDTSQSIQNSSMMIEQLLAFSTHSPKVCRLLLKLEQRQTLVPYSPQLCKLTQKYLHSKQPTKLDTTSNPQTSIVRALLITKLLEQQSTPIPMPTHSQSQSPQRQRLIESAKYDQNYCYKLIGLIEDMINVKAVKKMSIDCTEFVVLCVNLIRVREVLGVEVVGRALAVLAGFCRVCDGLVDGLMNERGDDDMEMWQVLCRMIGQNWAYCQHSLQLLTLYIQTTTSNNPFPQISQTTKQLTTTLSSHIPKQTKTNLQMIQQSSLSQQLSSKIYTNFLWQQKPMKLNIQKQIVQKICMFLESSLEKLNVLEKQMEMGKGKGKEGYIQEEGLKVKIGRLRNEVFGVAEVLMVVGDCEVIGNLLVLLSKYKRLSPMTKLHINQCLANCMPYSLTPTLANSLQHQQIHSMLTYLQNLPISEQTKLKSEIGLKSNLSIPFPSNPNTTATATTEMKAEQKQNNQTGKIKKESGLDIVLEFIKKSIENQFQFAFNKESMRSVCHLFCYLRGVIEGEYDQERARDKVLHVIKMLLNLNQSCQKQHRQLLVHQIIKTLSTYSPLLLKDNPFLTQTLLQKLLTPNPFIFKQQLLYLTKNKLINNIDLFNKLYDNLQKGCYCQNYEENDIDFLFQLLVSSCFYAEEKEKVEDVMRRFGWDGDVGRSRWEWFGRVNEAGKKVYEGDWRLDEKEFRLVREKMLQFPIQFDNDILKMEAVLRNK